MEIDVVIEGVFMVEESSLAGDFAVELLERRLLSGVRAVLVVSCELDGNWKSWSGTVLNVRTGS